MKNGIILSAVMAALCASGETVKTATQPWVRSYVATNRTDVSGKADATNVYTKAETDAKIVELAPPADLTPSTNYTDAALGAFAVTGSVARISDGTNMIEAAGSVYAAATTTTAWNFTSPVAEISIIEPVRYYAEGSSVDSWVEWRGAGWYCFAQYEGADYTTSFSVFMVGEANADRLENVENEIYLTRRVAGKMYPVGKLALTNDLPDVSGYTTPADVTAAIREQSLGGIYDSELGVWWTPIMQNGALRYVATTNVNLSAGGNQ